MKITSKGGRAKPIQTDVSDEEQVERMVSETIKEFGQVDILVNNSGIAGHHPGCGYGSSQME